ncbi:TetR/AcrR family transcriptional regulator [Williamsia maris]|uniref:Transcriptional regulator, TetR family n=1 Tax=Williamsia maris TaxID=72806 RepID=A0ABT1HB88_9NOCA|nr:TetR/AcrR family transcriptional regulator [Williamsia maris]MCP2175525.1 transcriptional regulator, TetR family [Williamsia maris]
MVTAKTSGTPRGRLPRGTLSADDIVAAAFEVANESTLANFSMPALASHLGVGVTSIYWHFRRKEELLDAMTEFATAEYHLATPVIRSDNWKDALRKHFRAMRATFQSNPVLVELVLLRDSTSFLDSLAVHTTAQKLDSTVGEMVEAGFSPDDAMDVYLSLLAHVCGSAMIEHQGVFSREVQDETSRESADARSGPLFRELAERGRYVPDVENMTFDFIFSAILSHAESTCLAEPPNPL